MTAGKLRERQILTVGHVARVGEAALVTMLGAHAGRHLHALAHNHDPRRVRVGHRRGSIGSQCALGRRPRPFEEIDATLAALVDRVTRRMRGGEPGRPHGDAAVAVRRLHPGDPVAQHAQGDDADPGDPGRPPGCCWPRTGTLIEERGLTLIGVAVSNLDGDGYVQLELPFETAPDDDRLDTALDAVRDRFGGKAVTRAASLGQDLNPSVPILSD